MGFIRNSTVAVASGVGVGTLFYILGGVATAIFPTILPFNMAILGFASAVAIALAEGEKADAKK